MPKLWQDEASHIEEMYEDDELIQQERSQQEEITSHQEEEVHEDPLELTEKNNDEGAITVDNSFQIRCCSCS